MITTSGGRGIARTIASTSRPVHRRQVDVQQHNVELRDLQHRQRFGTVACLLDEVACVGQQRCQHVAKIAVIVDDQHTPGRGRRLHEASLLEQCIDLGSLREDPPIPAGNQR
jgi:hypothetical protein